MGIHTAGLNRWVKSAEAATRHAVALNIGPRLILGFLFIILSMLAADAVILSQFQVIRAEAERLNHVDQKLVSLLRVHASLLAYYDRLDALADTENAAGLVMEAGPLQTAVVTRIRDATSTLGHLPSDLQTDPAILPTLQVIRSALTSQLDGITTLATAGDWRAVHRRLENQVRPLESLASTLVDKVANEARDQQADIALRMRRVERLVFLVVPLAAVVTLLIAATLGLAITRSITQPLARLVEASQALARGEFHHQVSVTGNDELAALGRVFNDTTRRLRDLYATLQSREAYLAEAQRLSRTGSFGWRATAGDIVWSEETFRIFEYDQTMTPTVERVLQRTHPEDVSFVKETIARAVRDGADLDIEHRLLMPEGAVKYVHVVGHVEKDPDIASDSARGVMEYVGTIMDVTERKLAEQALAVLAGRLIHAQEQERSRIARELHDHISQSLGVLTITIDQLCEDPRAAGAGLAPAMEDLREKGREIIRDVHLLSHRLHSSTLDYLGLVPALQKLVGEYSERHGISIEFVHAAVPAPLASDIALCLYRLAEESLTNIVKHSGARSAHVHLTGEPDFVHLSVEDTGAGFDATRHGDNVGLGLISMQERVRLVRGTLRIDSTPSKGARIDVWIPSTVELT